MSYSTHPLASLKAAGLARWTIGKKTIQEQLPVKFPGYDKAGIDTLQYRCGSCNELQEDGYFAGDVTLMEDGTFRILAVGACPDCETGAWCAWKVRYQADTGRLEMVDVLKDYPMPIREDGTRTRAIDVGD
ncbi:hypothetical protein J2J97_32400 (plasmid) [Rhizobium bangladeshense]|uniref:hypothetical protein n=1 Tax=Rhizobium bangladeshense TaxID=1138189 RepID=UPI001A981E85|nr:hypothetical protein [Rhizobium bangladeshense]QSY98607.1 hypothetical protein J2J97_32400 [Rhizobium bangladeshense]